MRYGLIGGGLEALVFDGAEALERDVAGWVDTGEAGIAELVQARVADSGGGIHAVAIEVEKVIDAELCCDLVVGLALGDELSFGRHVDAVGTRGDERWAGDTEGNCFCADGTCHFDDPSRRVAAHN